MGGIIIDGMTAVQFKGSLKKFGKALGHLTKLEAKIDGLKIDTVPLPEAAGIAVLLKFSRPVAEFVGSGPLEAPVVTVDRALSVETEELSLTLPQFYHSDA